MKIIKGFNKVNIGESLEISIDLFTNLLNTKNVVVKIIKDNYKDSFNNCIVLEYPVIKICDRIKNYLDDYDGFKKHLDYRFKESVFDDIVLEISKSMFSKDFCIELFRYEPILTNYEN